MKNNKTLRCEPGDCGRSNLPNFTENDLLLRGGAKKGSNGRANSIHMMDDADVSGELIEGLESRMWRRAFPFSDLDAATGVGATAGRIRRSLASRMSGLSTLRKEWDRFTGDRGDYSFWLFSPQDRFRIWCAKLTSQNWFDFIILTFISANCITLAMERPNIPPWSTERKVLDVMNHVFTVVFTIEMVFKVTGHSEY